MSKGYSVQINAHQELLADSTTVSWPAADGTTPFSGVVLPALLYAPGDYILGNRGMDTTYTSTDGALTLTFGSSIQSTTFSGTGSDNTSATTPYSGPYCSVAPGSINLEDEAFLDVELLGIASQIRDPHSKTYPIKWLSGETQTTGLHIVKHSVGKIHTNPHSPTRYHLHDIVFQVTSSDSTPNATGQCSLGIVTKGGTGKIILDDGASTWTLADSSATPMTNVPKGSYIAFDLTQASTGAVLTIFPEGTDFTDPSKVQYTILGKLSDVRDSVTLQYWTSGHHPGAHQVHDVHLHPNLPRGGSSNGVPAMNSSKYYLHSINFKVTTSNTTAKTASIALILGSNPAIVFKNGNPSITTFTGANARAIPLTNVACGTFLVYDTGATTPGWDTATAAQIGSDANETRYIVVGQLSEHQDPHSKQYYLHGPHVGAIQQSGLQIGDSSVNKVHLHKSNHGRGHFVNMTFQCRGGSTAPFIQIAPHGSGSCYFVPDDGSGEVVLTAGTIIPTASMPGGTAAGAPGAILLFHTVNYTWSMVTPTTDLTQASWADYMKIGHLSHDVDPHSKHYVLHLYHGNSGEAAGVNHAPGAVNKPHLNPTNHGRAHFVNCTFQCRGGSSAPFIQLKAHNTGSCYYVPDDGSGEVVLTPGTIIPTSAMPGGTAAGAPGAMLLFHVGTKTWLMKTPNTDITTAAWNDYMKIGHLSHEVDPHAGHYVLHLYHGNSGEAAGVNHAPGSVGKLHNHLVVPSKHLFRDTTFSVSGTGSGSATVSWTSGYCIDDTGTQIGNPINAGSIAGVLPAQILVFDTTAAAGSNILKVGQGTTLPLTQLTIGHLDNVADATTGQYHFVGWHTGHQQVHGDKIAPNAVSSSHVKAGSILSSHIPANQIGVTHIVAGAIQGGVGTSKNHIAAGSVGSGEIGSDQIGTAHIAAGTVHGGEAGTKNHIATGAVLSGHVGAGQINGSHFANGAVNLGGSAISGILGGSLVGTGINAGNVTQGSMSGLNRLSWSSNVYGPALMGTYSIGSCNSAGNWSLTGTQFFGVSLGSYFNGAHSYGWGIAISVSAINGPNPYGYDAVTAYLQPKNKLNSGVGAAIYNPNNGDQVDILWQSGGSGGVGILINDVRVDNAGTIYVLFQLAAQYNAAYLNTTFNVQVYAIWRGQN